MKTGKKKFLLLLAAAAMAAALLILLRGGVYRAFYGLGSSLAGGNASGR